MSSINQREGPGQENGPENPANPVYCLRSSFLGSASGETAASSLRNVANFFVVLISPMLLR